MKALDQTLATLERYMHPAAVEEETEPSCPKCGNTQFVESTCMGDKQKMYSCTKCGIRGAFQ